MIDTLAFVLTGIGLSASIVYYANILNNANKTREMQLKAQNLTNESRQSQLLLHFSDRALSHEATESATILREAKWSNYEEWLELHSSDSDYWKAFSYVFGNYDVFGTLVYKGTVDISYGALNWSQMTISFWEHHKEMVYNERKRLNNKMYYAMYEYLVTTLKKYLEAHPELAP